MFAKVTNALILRIYKYLRKMEFKCMMKYQKFYIQGMLAHMRLITDFLHLACMNNRTKPF